ncbi:MAG: FapA family protein [Leptospiraceae bacterium]|nr:FapA family protein [Leptospiraceae bacterium]
MDKLKSLLYEEEFKMDKEASEKVEVLGDTIDECLRLAAIHLKKPIHELDYEVLKRGKKSLFFSEPFHIRVFPVSPDEALKELEDLDKKLTGGTGKLTDKSLQELIEPKDADGYFRIKNYRHGVYLAVFPPIGNGKPVRTEDVIKKLNIRGITPMPPESRIAEVVEAATGEYERLGDTKLKPFAESQIKIEISQDKMKAFATITPPKPGGRDLEVQDVIYELKKEDIAYGIKEDDIRKALDKEIYNEPILVAAGDPPIKGNDAKIIYHVRIEKNVVLKEDDHGRVDFRELNLIENVVVGQLLAEKIPAEKGKYGRDLFNQPLEAKDGVDVPLLAGKGTILSEDGLRLTAEVNGQVVFYDGKINVETVYKVNGDVNMKTGNINFLGSIVITGNVEDNFQIKASGNVEVYGTVQKAIIEADGDIIIRQGITGRNEAKIISTNGNIVARFIQDATVITDKDVIVQEVIMNSNVSAGGKIVCNGKKAFIVGGVLRAGRLVLAKNIGSKAYTPTTIVVGLNPKLSKQLEDYQDKRMESIMKKEQLMKTLNTVYARRDADPASFTEENKEYMEKLEAGLKKLDKRIKEYDKEIQTLQNYLEQTSQMGKVSFEKKMYPGVTVTIKNSEPFICKNELQAKTFFLENDKIKQKKYTNPELEEEENKRAAKKPAPASQPQTQSPPAQAKSVIAKKK